MNFSLAQLVTILVVYVIFVGSYIFTSNPNNSELYIWLTIMIAVALPLWSTFLTIRFFLERG